MLRGAQEGFFGLTNQENAVAAPKFQYCCREEEKNCRPEFASKTPDVQQASEKGHIFPAGALALLPDEIRDCQPKDFFDTQISPQFVKRCMVDTTNAQAALEGAGFGGTQYNGWEPFDVAKMNKFIGLLFVNGLSPRPMIKMWFEPHPIFVNTLIVGAIHKPCTRGRRALHGMRQWAQF
jgi:hypothetical protein